jgi:hypothetical protein
MLGVVFLGFTVCLAVTSAALPGSGRDRGGIWGTVELVSTESQDTSLYVSTGVDASGTVHVVWGDYNDEADIIYDVFYKKKPAGGSWTAVEQVSTGGTSLISNNPLLAVEPDGTVHVTWEVRDSYGGSGTDTDIFYRQKPGGGSWSAIELVSSESSGDSLDPCIAVDPSGTRHISWRDETNYAGCGTDTDVFYKQKPAGGSWSTTEIVSTESTNYIQYHALAVDAGGAVHTAWQDDTNYGGSGTDRDIFYKQKSTTLGWLAAEIVSQESTSDSWTPALAAGPGGTVHAAWRDDTDYGGSGTDADVFYKKRSGGSWTSAEIVSTESTDGSYFPAITVDPDKTVHVTWNDSTDYGGSGVDTDVFYKKKPDGGDWTLTEVISVEVYTRSQVPAIAVDAHRTAHVVWGQYMFKSGRIGLDYDICYNSGRYRIYVDDANTSGPWEGTMDDPYQTIQDGIDGASDYMTVMVADGTYTGTGNRGIDYNGKAITVRSENGPLSCVIDCEASIGDYARAFVLNSGESTDSVIMGFTIQNGNVMGAGGGIYCSHTSPTIINNVIMNCRAGTFGRDYGGGIHLYFSTAVIIENNLIVGNYAGDGGGISCRWSYPTLINNTITANEAGWKGGGLYIADYSDPVIVNTIVWHNKATTEDNLYIPFTYDPSITYCNIQGGYTGTGNIDADPLFVIGPYGEYYLAQIASGHLLDSPCVNTGDPLSEMMIGTTRTDCIQDDGVVDMGYHNVMNPSFGGRDWGNIRFPPGGALNEAP